MTSTNLVAASSPDGSIYDLGYRHYEGARHGRLYAIWSLYIESLRGIWGFGRPMTAKAAPFILAGLYAFYAFLQLAFSSVISQAIASGGDVGGLATYSNYFMSLWIVVVLFCIAQAPELVCKDQRHHVLPLYFTRALRRHDYALSKLGALTTALFIVLMIPMVALFVGDILMQSDMLKAIGDEWPKALPTIPAYLLVALGMAALSLGLSAFSPRRAYAAIGLVGYVLVVEAVAAIVYETGRRTTGWDWSDKAVLFGPVTSLMGATQWFFGEALSVNNGFPATLGSDVYVLVSVASIAIFTSILLFRYRRIAA